MHTLLLSIIALVSGGELELPWMFNDNMVIQRQQPILIWGEGIPGENVKVILDDETASCQVNAQGRWSTKLQARQAQSLPLTLTVSSGLQEIVFENVLIGDVWLCAGQSNMDFALRSAVHSAEDIAGQTLIRLCNRQGDTSTDQQAEFYSGSWQIATKESIEQFSAVGYFFAQSLQPAVGVPIGMVDISVGGSTTEGWLSQEILAADEELEPLLHDYLSSPLTHPWVRSKTQSYFFEPSFLHTHAISELAPFALKGVLWYQGESNAHLPRLAGKMFRLLVNSWRELWQSPALPILYVQLPGMQRPTWPKMRAEQQRWQDMDGVHMAVAIDVGHPTDVHPKNKKPVGERLALIARKEVYTENIECHGPVYSSHQRLGAELHISLKNAGKLIWEPSNSTTAFEIAGKDRRFYPAQATVDGNKIILTSLEVPKPIDARYAEAAYPQTGLKNSNLLPAAPFRTYTWQPIKIACIGDSITAGHGLKQPQIEAYPAVLQGMLGDGYEVANFGKSGCCVTESTMRGEWHRAYSKNLEHQLALQFHPDIVICNLGINDIMEWNSKKSEFVDDYIKLLDEYEKLPSKPEILIWGPLAPLFPGQRFHQDRNEIEIHKALKKIGLKAHCDIVDMNKPLLDFAAWFPDFIHPDARASQKIAEVVWKRLVKKKMVAPNIVKTKVIVLTGQSNSLGTTADNTESDVSAGEHPADSNIRFFWNNRSTAAGDGPATSIGNSNQSWKTLIAQQGQGANKTFWGPEFGLGRQLYDEGLRNFVIIKASRGGGGNSFWSKKSDDSHMYTHVTQTTQTALELLGPHQEYEVAAVYYIQGESDNTNEAKLSGKRLTALYNNLRKDLPNAKSMQMIVGGIAASGANRNVVRANQQEAASSNKNISYISTLDLAANLYDQLHFDKSAKLEIGKRFADAFFEYAVKK